MSIRMLQRALRDQQELQTVTHDDEDVDETDGRELVRNPFNLLESPDEPEDAEARDCASETVLSDKRANPLQASSTKSKKKKKKKAKVKVGVLETTTDDVDELLERLSFSGGQAASTSHSAMQTESRWVSGNKSAEVLTVNTKHLRAEDELKRIFGSKVIHAVERSSGSGSGGMRWRLGKGNLLRKTTLVTPMENWHRWDGSISMEFTGAQDKLQYFKYVFSSSYMDVQRSFEASGASYDPNSIAMLLHHHPYHLESLLALAEVYKQLGDYQQAVQCLEKCIYALECAWHPLFTPFNSTCRLPFSCDENKPFFFALFKHMQHLGRRGCHRSALEVCKLLLSVDSDDPLGAIFSIDYFALRAEQFEWLEYFADCYNNDSSLVLLPNFSFSLAVARFHLEHQQQRQISSVRSKEMPRHVEIGAVSSHVLLKQALMLHPATLCKIMDKAPIKKDAVWERILKHSHFAKATPGGPSLEHLINLYVERNYVIWRVPELQTWLKSAALAVTEAADKDSGEVANWSCVREEAFQSENNEYRHLHLSEFSDSTPTIPAEDIQQIMFQGDGGEMDRVHALVEDGNQAHDHLATLEGRNALLVFLQSLLPWTDYGVNAHDPDVGQLAPAADGTDSEDEQ